MHLKRFLSAIFILLISTQAFAACEIEIDNLHLHYKNRVIVGVNANQSGYDENIKSTERSRIKSQKETNEKIAKWSASLFDSKQTSIDRANVIRGLQEKRSNLSRLGSNRSNEIAIQGTQLDILRSEVTLCELNEIISGINAKISNQNTDRNTANQTQARQPTQQESAISEEQRRAQESQQAQQIQQTMQQSQQQAQQNQQRADQARQGKRKTHDPAAEAHDCIEVDTKSLYGGFKNKCSYPVSYGYCINNPRKGAWTDSTIFSCAGMAAGKPTAGGQSIRANGYDVNHTKGGDAIYSFACKQPAYAIDLTVVIGQGIQGRCGTW